MPDVFGIEGVGGPGAPRKPGPRKPASRGEPDLLYGSMKPQAGEGPAGRYVQYDNESGAIMLNLPARFSKLKHELEEELMEEFYGEPGGAAESSRSIDSWVKAWIEKKEREHPELVQPDEDGL
jgi:hypothetical protein